MAVAVVTALLVSAAPAAADTVTTLLVSAAPAAADTVTTLADSGPGSLRSAIAVGGTVSFAPGLEGTIQLSSELTIDKDVTIDGPSDRGIVLSGNHATRVLRVSDAGADVVLDDLTIADGRAGDPLPFGGGLLVEFAERVRLERVALVDSAADSSAAFPGLDGGAFVRYGHFEVVDATVARNRVLDDNGGGGGLFLAETGTTFAIARSTIAGNEADFGPA